MPPHKFRVGQAVTFKCKVPKYNICETCGQQIYPPKISVGTFMGKVKRIIETTHGDPIYEVELSINVPYTCRPMGGITAMFYEMDLSA